ncbi:MAG: hypothetical protein GY696_40225 [Gammaproteobacteria bacterium]|nr:hypothetical protein [Gammaproteobacteria bacterium]
MGTMLMTKKETAQSTNSSHQTKKNHIGVTESTNASGQLKIQQWSLAPIPLAPGAIAMPGNPGEQFYKGR